MFYQSGPTIMNFLRIYGTHSIKTRKTWPIFSSFNPFPPSMPSVAIGDRKQFWNLIDGPNSSDNAPLKQ